jgi:hypothetical protein
MKRKNNTFYCFSPPVMFATFAIEISLMLYVLFRYRMNALTRLIAGMLGLLAVFQFAEYHVCQDVGGVTGFYSRLGFMAITMLPPIALHLVHIISGKGSKKVITLAYASGAAFALTFGLNSAAFQSYSCGGNYAMFQLADNLGGLFFAYYYFWLTTGLLYCLRFSVTAKRNTRESLTYQAFGYISLLVPTGIVNAMNPATISAIPSVMCGFAVIYAFALVFGIAPRTLKEKVRSNISSRNKPA